VGETKEEAKKWVEEETSRVTRFSDGSLIDGMVGAARLLCVDGVVKQAKGVQLGTTEWYGVYKAEGMGMVLALECLRLEQDEEIEGNIIYHWDWATPLQLRQHERKVGSRAIQ
jgi:hypothetical protein